MITGKDAAFMDVDAAAFCSGDDFCAYVAKNDRGDHCDDEHQEGWMNVGGEETENEVKGKHDACNGNWLLSSIYKLI